MNRAQQVTTVSPGAIALVSTALMAIGLVSVASATASLDRSLLSPGMFRTPFGKQLIFAAVAIALMLATTWAAIPALASAKARRFVALGLFGFAVVLLLAALIPGLGDPHRGSNRWLNFAQLGLNVRFQPSELAKLALVTFLAYRLTKRNVEPKTFLRSFLPNAAAVALMIALVGKENFGTAGLLACVAGSMLLVGGCRFLHLGSLAAIGGAGLTYLLLAATYRMDRVTAFLDIWNDPQGKGYQPIQSLATIASGGWYGRGLGEGIQKYGYLPECHTDFIFAVLCEEAGAVGGFLVIGLFCAFLWLGIRVMLAAPTPFERMLALGLTLTITLQAAINIAVVTVVAPTTGVPLPMLSAGGSGLLTVSVGIGVLCAIAIRGQRAAAFHESRTD